MKRSRDEKKGFILVLVVSLAAIITLLGAALVSLTRVESVAVDYKTHLSVARDNARGALDLALGDLQRFAGRDQTATALADGFRSPTAENFTLNSTPVDSSSTPKRIYQPFWTGVWDNDPTTTDDPEWLVTRPLPKLAADQSDFNGVADGVNASPLIDPYLEGDGIDYVTLVNAFTADFDEASASTSGTQVDFNVSVPLETIESPSVMGSSSDSTIGKYGYWVGDMGVKGNYAIPYRWNDVAYDLYDNANESDLGSRTRLKQMIGQTHAFSLIDPTVNPNLSRLPYIISDFQMRVPFGDSWPPTNVVHGLSLKGMRQTFHDNTVITRGVLINGLEGGLKKDLTPMELTLDADPVVDGALLCHANLSSISVIGSNPLLRTISAVPAVPNSGGSAYSGLPRIGPVVTEFNMNFAVYLDRTGVGGADLKGRLKYNGDLELWNPYTSSLTDPNGTFFTVEITALPKVDVQYQATGYSLNEDSVNLSARVPAAAFSLDMSVPLRPGQIRLYSGGSSIAMSETDAENADTTLIDISTDFSFTDPTPDVADDTFSILVKDTCRPSIIIRNSNGDEVSRYTASVTFENFSDDNYTNVPIDDDSARFGYTWERKDPILGGDNWGDFDPRVETIPPTRLQSVDLDPRASANYSHTTASGLTHILGYNPSGSDLDVSYDVPLFELPRQELVSIAEFQHANLGTAFPRQIGRDATTLSDAGIINYNRLFDQYFFSTIPPGVSSWSLGDPLANARIRPGKGVALADLQASLEKSAQYLLVEGMFNVNSTSIAAWTAVLKSIRLGSWSYYDYSSGVGGASSQDFSTNTQFVYYSQSAEEVWEVNTDIEKRGSFRRGLRSFPHGDVVSLATKIVDQVRTKIDTSGPFENLKNFVDSGVLDTAIANASLNPGSADMVPDSPRFLNQGTLLNSLAPFLSTRSDTFLIRAYGDSRNRSDGNDIVARAYCEAVVQRLPEKHSSDGDATNPMSPTTENVGEFGRKFQVIAFRWMTGEEI